MQKIKSVLEEKEKSYFQCDRYFILERSTHYLTMIVKLTMVHIEDKLWSKLTALSLNDDDVNDNFRFRIYLMVTKILLDLGISKSRRDQICAIEWKINNI
jgi:hypothetical protein